MKIRPLLWLTAIVSSILGATVVYLVLSVPNDLRADALLKQARKDVAAGDSVKARESLATIVQQYPRTDAAAAATVALVSLGQKERDDLGLALKTLRQQNEQQAQLIAALQQSVGELKAAPPKVTTVTAPAPKPAPKKNTTTTKKKTPTKRTRRHR